MISLLGFWAGILGISGGIILIPILTFFMTFGVNEAILIALIVSFLISSIETIKNIKVVKIKEMLRFFSLSFIGVSAASILIPELSDLIKSLILFFVIITILFFKAEVNLESKKNKIKKITLPLITGFLTYTVGVGGSFLIIPVLINGYNLNYKEAVNNSFLIIFLNTSLSLIFYNFKDDALLSNVLFSEGVLSIIGLFIVGFFIGRQVSNKVKNKNLEILYKATLALAGILIIGGQYVK